LRHFSDAGGSNTALSFRGMDTENNFLESDSLRGTNSKRKIMKENISTPEYFLRKSPAERIAIYTIVGREDLESTLNHRKESDDWRERFSYQLERWFNRLKWYMKTYKLSKENLAEHNLDYADCVNFYYSHRG
jgi:hypothetical protein